MNDDAAIMIAQAIVFAALVCGGALLLVGGFEAAGWASLVIATALAVWWGSGRG
jgi:hypothetical protein